MKAVVEWLTDGVDTRRTCSLLWAGPWGRGNPEGRCGVQGDGAQETGSRRARL